MSDTELVNAMADFRIVDGIGDVDIDEQTLKALPKQPNDSDWVSERRVQFRIAVERWIEQERA